MLRRQLPVQRGQQEEQEEERQREQEHGILLSRDKQERRRRRTRAGIVRRRDEKPFSQSSPSSPRVQTDEENSGIITLSFLAKELAWSSLDREESINRLSDAILRNSLDHCAFLSKDERFAIAEAVIDVVNEGAACDSFGGGDSESMVVDTLCDFLDIAPNVAFTILKDAFSLDDNNDNEGGTDIRSQYKLQEEVFQALDDDAKTLTAIDDDEISTESDDGYLKAGECELCERETKLTLHHLIPKSTWKIIKQRFLNASKPYREGDLEKVKAILDLGDELPVRLVPETFSCGNLVKLVLAGHTAALCRPCHNCVHANHDNMELAEKFNTIEKLLGDERIYRFCKWQNKQKPGKYAIRKC